MIRSAHINNDEKSCIDIKYPIKITHFSTPTSFEEKKLKTKF